MKRFTLAKFGLIGAFFTVLFSLLQAHAIHTNQHMIRIAGLVVNAQNLLPVSSATIFDAAGHMLGTTDKNGYYNISMNDEKSGEIYFSLKIVKLGFEPFTQQEHWGNLSGNIKNIMYFGLRQSKNAAKPFCSFANTGLNNSILSFDNVLAYFDQVKTERKFEDELEKAKTGNQHVLISLNQGFYLVDHHGWIKIGSGRDSVSINNQTIVPAEKLNAIVKRKEVKGMTPVSGKPEKFAIYTR